MVNRRNNTKDTKIIKIKRKRIRERRERRSDLKNCKIKVRNRSLDSCGDALGNEEKSLERIFGFWEREKIFRTEAMWYTGKFILKNIVTYSNMFLGSPALKTVGASWGISSWISLKNPIQDRSSDRLWAFDAKEPWKIS